MWRRVGSKGRGNGSGGLPRGERGDRNFTENWRGGKKAGRRVTNVFKSGWSEQARDTRVLWAKGKNGKISKRTGRRWGGTRLQQESRQPPGRGEEIRSDISHSSRLPKERNPSNADSRKDGQNSP